jgi:TetR/AcrR family transcriptional regulator, tetracycline repressor protein
MPEEHEQERRRLPLTRDRIVRTALQVVDVDGLDALTMRRLGTELGVTTMAVYHHFPNKSALYDGIVEAVMAEIDVSADDRAKPFAERVTYAARAYRDVLVAHPHALPVMLSREPRTPGALVPVETLVGIFRDAGFSPVDAWTGMNVTAAMVMGVAVYVANDRLQPPEEDITPEQLAEALPADRFPHLLEVMSTDAAQDVHTEFEVGLDTLVRGFEARLAGARG